jgi:DNA-binding CsgD family transcriptional regulator
MLCPRVVGRPEEVAWISASLDGLREGRGGSAFFVGEPGIGKSRLAEEAVVQAGRRGVWVLSGRASATARAVPYQSLTGALLYGLRSRPLAELPEGLGGVRAGLATLLPGLVEGPAVEPSPVLLGETVLRLVAGLGGDYGTLVVLEDLHWACGDTLAVTEYLADNAAMERVVVLGTSRPAGAAVSLIDALVRRGSATVRLLEPLSREEVSEMAAGCLAERDGSVSEALGDVLRARAEGLPFLVEELLAGLVNRGTLVASDSGWKLSGDVGAVDVPLSFAQTVRERLATLPGPERGVVECAALLGRDFDWSHLPRVTHASEAEVLDALSRAVDLQLVEDIGGDRFRFRHALTVEAILALMLHPRRMRLAARALDDLVEDRQSVAPDLFELAAHLAAQAGRGADALWYLTEEARRSLAVGALATASATARRARNTVPADEPEALAASEVLLSALSLAGDTAAVEEVGRELLARLEALGASAERRAKVRLSLAKAAHAAFDLRSARQLCEEALALDPRDERLRLEVDLALAEISFSERKHGAAVAGTEAVLAGADAAGFDDLACDALDLLGRHRMFVALELAQAEPYLLESLRRAEAADLPLTRLRVLHQLALLDLLRGSGPVRINQGRRLAEELGALALTAEFDHTLATYYAIAHELDLASHYAERALAAARRYRLSELTMLVIGLRGTIEAMRGHREEAERQVAAATAEAGELGPLMRAALSGTALVLAALADDDLRTAQRRVSETRMLLPPDRILFQPPFFGSFYGVAAVVQAAAGAHELVEGRDWVQFDDVYMRGSFNVARAILAGRAGDVERAAALFAAGDEGFVSVPWFRALCRRYAAEAALTDGWGDPAAWLRDAELFFEGSGNAPLARACRSLLRLAGTSPQRRRARADGSRQPGIELTTREGDVLALLAEGLTNREIASRLYLSPRTVEKHVERILAKTGQVNRTALAAFAAEQRLVSPRT